MNGATADPCARTRRPLEEDEDQDDGPEPSLLALAHERPELARHGVVGSRHRFSRGGRVRPQVPCQDAGTHWIVHLSASLRGDTPFAAFARPLRTSLLLPAMYLPRLLRFATTDASTNGVHRGGPASSALTSIATLPFMRADASVAGAVQSGSAGSDWLTHPASLRSQRSSPAAPASQGSPSLQTRSLLPWTSEVRAPATSSSR